MAQTAPNLASGKVQAEDRQEFWKPAIVPPVEGHEIQEASAGCPTCGIEIIEGHACPRCSRAGAETSAVRGDTGLSRSWRALVDQWRQASGRNLAATAALVAGGACVVTAAATSLFFKPTNFLDWQAVQIWRIEWLLAAIAILLAGILLKKK